MTSALVAALLLVGCTDPESGDSGLSDGGTTLEPLDAAIVVVTGQLTGATIALDALGLDYALVDGGDADGLREFLLEPGGLDAVDLVFFDGGHVEAGLLYPGQDGDAQTPAAVLDALRAFVDAGNRVFVTDWSYDLVEGAWPDMLDFVGRDTVSDAAQVEDFALGRVAVTDASLAAWLDLDYLPVDLLQPVCAPIETASDSVSVHLSAPVVYLGGSLVASPQLVSFRAGGGLVHYSAFRLLADPSPEPLLVLQYLLYEG